MNRLETLAPELVPFWDELSPQVRDETPPMALEAMCSQARTMREAADRVRQEGAVVIDGKGNATEHPALRIEREAAKQLRDWLTAYARRTGDRR